MDEDNTPAHLNRKSNFKYVHHHKVYTIR